MKNSNIRHLIQSCRYDNKTSQKNSKKIHIKEHCCSYYYQKKNLIFKGEYENPDSNLRTAIFTLHILGSNQIEGNYQIFVLN